MANTDNVSKSKSKIKVGSFIYFKLPTSAKITQSNYYLATCITQLTSLKDYKVLKVTASGALTIRNNIGYSIVVRVNGKPCTHLENVTKWRVLPISSKEVSNG